MPVNSEVGRLHAIEAIAADTVSLMSLFLSFQHHPKAALLLPGLLPQASMFVVESRRCISILAPQIGAVLSRARVDYLRPSRHRAKLLDDRRKSVEEVASDLATIAEQQRQLFLGRHTGFFGPLKRLIQPDLGLSIYDGHIFSTTHATAFNFGEGCDFATSAFSVGRELGAYTASLASLLHVQLPSPLPTSALPGNIEMRDIKSDALYRRGPLGTAPMVLAAGMTFLLANLNYVHYVVRRLLPKGGLTLLRLKFIMAFHADANLAVIQSRLVTDSSTTAKTLSVFREALSNPESKWLRKRSRLRNLLVHYSADRHLTAELSLNATRKQVIEHLSGNLTYDEIDALLDRHIAHMSRTLETGFDLSGDLFWYGQVT